jgi:hypothetical protein
MQRQRAPGFARRFRDLTQRLDVCARLGKHVVEVVADGDEGEALVEEFSDAFGAANPGRAGRQGATTRGQQSRRQHVAAQRPTRTSELATIGWQGKQMAG